MRRIVLLGLGLVCSCHTFAQLKKYYSLDNDTSYDTINFSLSAPSGTCYIRPVQNHQPLNIYGNPDLSTINPHYETTTTNRVKHVNLELQDYQSSGLSKTISYSMFSPAKNDHKDFWKVYLTEDKVYDLNLHYGLGKADIDLSGIAVDRLKIKTGSADVLVDYQAGEENKVSMDTFYVKVDLGSLNARRMELSRAKAIITDIGFGTAVLNFKHMPEQETTVNAMVGAGSLEIRIPKHATPIIVNVTDSPLCRVRFANGFEEVDDNVFVNMSYGPDTENLLTFNIDVALGSVVFKYND